MRQLLVRNAAFNLLGGAVPALVALATIPFIVGKLGEAGYGVLALVTSIVGYFALLDINVTAGSIKFVAQHHAKRASALLFETISFGLAVYLVIGAVGCVGIYVGAPALVADLFTIPLDLRAESIAALRWAAFAFLFGQVQTYLQSVPQALQRYDVSGRVEALFGLVVPLLTVAVLWLGYGLVEVIIVRLAASMAHCLVLAAAVVRLIPSLGLRRPRGEVCRSLLSFSAYSFLSRIAALTYVHADKLVIGAQIGMQSLTYFAVPSTLANRVMSLTFRLSAVIYPNASALVAQQNMMELERVYLGATRYVFFVNGSVVLLMVVFAGGLLHFWMGEEFARQGALIMAVVAVAQLVDSLTNLPSLVNDGMGHPRVSGMFALARAVLGLALMYVLVGAYGIVGAAYAHLSASVVMTAAFLGYVHGRTVPVPLRKVFSQGYRAPAMAVIMAAAFAWLGREPASETLLALMAWVGASALTLGLLGTFLVLSPAHRKQLLGVVCPLGRG